MRLAAERQLTSAAHGHILANAGVWSPDGEWIVYDLRHDERVFDGTRIERVHARTGEVQILYRAVNGAAVGVPICNPIDDRIAFIHGPENPSRDWEYCAWHREGQILRPAADGWRCEPLDARDIVAPFTPGALRGGTHVHTFSTDGAWISCTYEDHVLASADSSLHAEPNRRTIVVCVPGAVTPRHAHPRNTPGRFFSVVAALTHPNPRPGSDEIATAFEDAWIADAPGTESRRIAFLGKVLAEDRRPVTELFLLTLPGSPDSLRLASPGAPLEGTEARMPAPPAAATQRRLTHTTERPHPGIQGPRHWPRSSPDGTQIACYLRDEAGIVQLGLVSATGSAAPRQLTRHRFDPQSAFSWSPDGSFLAYAMDNSLWRTDAVTGHSHRLTPRADDATRPTHHACVFSPDGRRLAYMRPVPSASGVFDQIFVADLLH